MIPLKSEQDLVMLRKSGRILAKVLKRLEQSAAPGIQTLELDALAEKLILLEGAEPAFKGYRGFPASLCASINEEIVHGIPGQRRLAEGDILSLDLGVNYEGYFTDAAVTIAVGKIGAQAGKLIDAARCSLYAGIEQARPNKRLSDISSAIQSFVEKKGFSVVREFVGHGIGFSLHEEPEIPNFGPPNQGVELKQGMVLAIEPMINMGTWRSEIKDNGWTAVTSDGLPSAHFEHTIAVTADEPEILTIEF